MVYVYFADCSLCAYITNCYGLQGDGLDAHVKDPGVHDIDEPEFSILKQRVARRIVSEGLNVDKLDIAALTKVRPTPLVLTCCMLLTDALPCSAIQWRMCSPV